MPTKKGTSKGTAVLKELQKYAKEYRKDYPNAKWQSAMKHAGRVYRKKHGTKKA